MRDVRCRWDASRPSIGANDAVQVKKSERLNICCGRMVVLINSRGCSQHCDCEPSGHGSPCAMLKVHATLNKSSLGAMLLSI